MSPERLVYDINESFQTIDSENIATTSNFVVRPFLKFDFLELCVGQ